MKYQFSIDPKTGLVVRSTGQELKSFEDLSRVVAGQKPETVVNSFLNMATIQESEATLIRAEAQWWPTQQELQAAEARLAITDTNHQDYLPAGDARDALVTRVAELTASRLKLEDGTYSEQTPDGSVQRQLPTDQFWPWLKSHRGVVGADPRPTPDMTSALAKAKAAKITLYDRFATEAIETPFSSSALGTAHTYSNERENQINLASAIASGVDPIDYTCTDGSDVKAQRSHTSAQLLTVMSDAMVHKATVTSNYHTKVAALNAATTVEDVITVSWS